MAHVDNPSDTGGRLIAASKVSGTSVYNAAGERLGSVHDVMLDKISGRSTPPSASAGSWGSATGTTRCPGAS